MNYNPNRFLECKLKTTNISITTNIFFIILIKYITIKNASRIRYPAYFKHIPEGIIFFFKKKKKRKHCASGIRNTKAIIIT